LVVLKSNRFENELDNSEASFIKKVANAEILIESIDNNKDKEEVNTYIDRITHIISNYQFDIAKYHYEKSFNEIKESKKDYSNFKLSEIKPSRREIYNPNTKTRFNPVYGFSLHIFYKDEALKNEKQNTIVKLFIPLHKAHELF
jgi:hypothetical protein